MFFMIPWRWHQNLSFEKCVSSFPFFHDAAGSNMLLTNTHILTGWWPLGWSTAENDTVWARRDSALRQWLSGWHWSGRGFSLRQTAGRCAESWRPRSTASADRLIGIVESLQAEEGTAILNMVSDGCFLVRPKTTEHEHEDCVCVFVCVCVCLCLCLCMCVSVLRYQSECHVCNAFAHQYGCAERVSRKKAISAVRRRKSMVST